MNQKLIKLSEILKQKPEIKKRLERLEFGCWIEEGERRLRIIYDLGFKNTTFFCIDLGNEFQGPQISFTLKDYPEYKILGHEPAYHDVLEFLGVTATLSETEIWHIEPNECITTDIKLSPGTLSEQSEGTLDKIILLLKKQTNK